MGSLQNDCAVEYRPFPPKPEKYRLGSDGTIQTLTRDGWRDLKTYKRGRGYHVVGMTVGGKIVRLNIAHAVLEAFVGPRPPGMCCRHLDGNRDNNSASNLCWGTLAENVHDSIRHGTHGVTKLTPGDVLLIRSSKEPARILAERFGITAPYVRQIQCGRFWAWV
jgi:hypothetical protein